MNRVLPLSIAGFVTTGLIEESSGSFEADKIVDQIFEGELTTEHAWLRFIEIAAKTGWRSAGCRAYLVTLAKRAAGPIEGGR